MRTELDRLLARITREPAYGPSFFRALLHERGADRCTGLKAAAEKWLPFLGASISAAQLCWRTKQHGKVCWRRPTPTTPLI
jgi:hypothetical protein